MVFKTILKLKTNLLIVQRWHILQDSKYRYLNHKQIRWRHTRNAFLGLQHWFFGKTVPSRFVENDDKAKSVLNLHDHCLLRISNYNLSLLEIFQVYLTMSLIWKSSSNVTQNQCYFNVLRTCKLKAIFHRCNTSYNTALVLQYKITQHQRGDTVQYWQRKQFQILVNLTKCCI